MKAAVAVGFLLSAGALALPGSGLAQGMGAAVVQGRSDHARLDAGELEMRAKIVELDPQSRIAVLRTPKGRILMADVPADVKGFSLSLPPPRMSPHPDGRRAGRRQGPGSGAPGR